MARKTTPKPSAAKTAAPAATETVAHAAPTPDTPATPAVPAAQQASEPSLPSVPAALSPEDMAKRKESINALYVAIAEHKAKFSPEAEMKGSLGSLSALWDKYAALHICGPKFNDYAATTGATKEAKAARLPWVKYLGSMNGDLTKAKNDLTAWQIAYYGADKTVSKFSRTKSGIFTARQTAVSCVKASSFTRFSV